MTQATQIADLLGGYAVLMRSVHDDDELRQMVREGVPASAVQALASQLGLSVREVTDILHLARRTVERRVSAQDKLRIHDSDRIVRLARIAVIADKALGHEQALRWLRLPNRALGGQIPLTLLDTEIGAREVEDVLGRIEFGVYS